MDSQLAEQSMELLHLLKMMLELRSHISTINSTIRTYSQNSHTTKMATNQAPQSFVHGQMHHSRNQLDHHTAQKERSSTSFSLKASHRRSLAPPTLPLELLIVILARIFHHANYFKRILGNIRTGNQQRIKISM